MPYRADIEIASLIQLLYWFYAESAVSELGLSGAAERILSSAPNKMADSV